MPTILVLPLVPKVVATVNSVVTGAFGGILFDFFYYNYSSRVKFTILARP